MIRRPAASLALLALAACNPGAKDKDERTATGKVLEGSISDSMIPYEALTSKPPLAPRVATHAAGSAESADSAPADAASAADAAPAAPAASSAISY